jgi:hypothetical protein
MFSDPTVHWPFGLSVHCHTTEVHVTIYHGHDVIDHDTLQFPHLLGSLQHLHEPSVFGELSLSLIAL